MGITRQKYSVVGTMRGVILLIGSKMGTIDFLTLKRSPYDIVIGDTMKEKYRGVLDVGNRMASCIID